MLYDAANIEPLAHNSTSPWMRPNALPQSTQLDWAQKHQTTRISKWEVVFELNLARACFSVRGRERKCQLHWVREPEHLRPRPIVEKQALARFN